MDKSKLPTTLEEPQNGTDRKVNRRYFLQLTGGALLAGTALMATACKDDDDDDQPTPTNNTVDLGTGDTGILNYAYALEQLEYAFYKKVVEEPFSGMTNDEKIIFTDLRDHEKAHMDFFRTALATNAIGALTPDFSAVDFTSRASVLDTAKTFEDLGVSAYNGAGQLLENADFLVVAGKIVSVEARHAAAIRAMLSPNTASFAGDDVVTVADGLDVSRTPMEVLTAADPFITTPVSGNNLPK